MFDSVDFQYKSAVLIMSTLQADRNECQQRTRRSVQTHTAHVRARKKKMAEMKVRTFFFLLLLFLPVTILYSAPCAFHIAWSRSRAVKKHLIVYLFVD